MLHPLTEFSTCKQAWNMTIAEYHIFSVHRHFLWADCIPPSSK